MHLDNLGKKARRKINSTQVLKEFFASNMYVDNKSLIDIYIFG